MNEFVLLLELLHRAALACSYWCDNWRISSLQVVVDFGWRVYDFIPISSYFDLFFLHSPTSLPFREGVRFLKDKDIRKNKSFYF